MSGYYITASGKHIHPENITTDDICLDDIAHHLTQIQRFGGSLPLGVRYSVAQHSILMAQYASKYGAYAARLALFHDASEAYLGDVITYLKRLMPDYMELESSVTHTILKKYKIHDSISDTSQIADYIQRLDKRILLTEGYAFFPQHIDDFTSQLGCVTCLDVEPQNETNPHQVKQLFLYWCRKLGIKD